MSRRRKGKFVKIEAGRTGRYWWINPDQVILLASNGTGCKVFYNGGYLDLTDVTADIVAEGIS